MNNLPHLDAASTAPFDILCNIFQLACHDDSQPYPPENLLLVCRWWNAVAIQDPNLWSKIEVVHPGHLPFDQLLARTSTYLTRSAQALIGIQITLHRHSGRCYLWSFCPQCASQFNEITQLFGTLIGENELHVNRWRSLNIDYRRSVVYDFWAGLQRQVRLSRVLLNRSMPRLEVLEISSPNPVRSASVAIPSGVVMPSWIQSAVDSYDSRPQYPALNTLILRGLDAVLPRGITSSTNFTTLCVETNSPGYFKNLRRRLPLTHLETLHLLPCDLSFSSSLTVGFILMINQAVNLRTLVVEISMKWQVEQILKDRDQEMTLLVRPPSYDIIESYSPEEREAARQVLGF